MLDYTFGEKKIHNTQSKPPLAEFEAILSRPIAYYMGDETAPPADRNLFHVILESDTVPPNSPFLQADPS